MGLSSLRLNKEDCRLHGELRSLSTPSLTPFTDTTPRYAGPRTQVAVGKRANKAVRGILKRLGLPDPTLDFAVFPRFFP